MKISIIIPVYNGSKYIEQRFAELKYYHNQEAEIIFVNDGSTDNTKALIEKHRGSLKTNIEQLSIINLKPNMGEHYARKMGAEAANNDDIYMADIDDPLSLSSLYALKYELQSLMPKTLLIIPKQIFVDGKPTGEVWRIPPANHPEEYMMRALIKQCGQIPLNNTILDKTMLLEAMAEVDNLLKAVGVRRLDFCVDSLTANVMIKSGLVKHIVQSESITAPYTKDNDESLSKNRSKRLANLPVFIGHLYHHFYSQFEDTDIAEKAEFEATFKDIVKMYHKTKWKKFHEDCLKYAERFGKYYLTNIDNLII